MRKNLLFISRLIILSLSLISFSFLVSFLNPTPLLAQSEAEITESYVRIDSFLNYRNYHLNSLSDSVASLYRRDCELLVKQQDLSTRLNGYIGLGEVDMKYDSYDSSFANYSQALSLDSLCYYCYDRLHWLMRYGKRNYAEAVKIRSRAIQVFEQRLLADSLSVSNWWNLWYSYNFYTSPYPRKVESRMEYLMRKIVKLDSTNASSWWRLSFYLDKDKTLQQQVLEKAYHLAPEYYLYWEYLIWFYIEQKYIDKMLVLLEQKPEQESLEYWYQMKVVFLYRAGLKDKAKQVFQEAKQLGFNFPFPRK
jgi:hypothetical protein